MEVSPQVLPDAAHEHALDHGVAPRQRAQLADAADPAEAILAEIPPEEKKLAREAILQSFYALRETMLEELDLDEPVLDD